MLIKRKVVILGLNKCNLCGHEWESRNKEARLKGELPVCCGKCKSPRWNKPIGVKQ